VADAACQLERLAERITAGETEAEAELCEVFQQRLRKLLTLMLFRHRVPQPDLVAAELAQEVLMRAVRRIRAGALQKSGSLAAFLQGIGGHVVREHVGKEKLPLRVALEDAGPASDPAAGPEARAIESENARLARRLLGNLRPRDREVLNRFYLKGQSKDEICADLGLNGGQFDQIKSRALRRANQLVNRRRPRIRQIFAKGLPFSTVMLSGLGPLIS
jgi:RNA polymerase sigma factor (sigma-70 family)